MRTHLMIATAAVATLLAGSAFAQAAPSDSAVNPSGADAAPQMPAAADSGQGGAMTKAPDAGQSTGAAPSDATVAPAAGAPAERTSAASAGGSDVVSNGPIPDTKANRAKYGKPLSSAGRMSKAGGN